MHAIANILLRKSAAASICCTVFFAFSSFSTYLDFVGDLAHWMDRRRRTHWDHQSRHWLHYIRSYWSCRQTADWRLERRSCTRHNSRRLTAKMEKENLKKYILFYSFQISMDRNDSTRVRRQLINIKNKCFTMQWQILTYIIMSRGFSSYVTGMQIR